MDKCVKEACAASWDESWTSGVKNSNNCSGFIKTVAQKLGLSLVDERADGIVDALERSWIPLQSGTEAVSRADAGFLVLAGLKSTDHSPAANAGHVVVIVTGAMYKGIYPRCWGGSTGSAQSQGEKSVGECWNKGTRDKVKYYCSPQKVCDK